MKWENKYIVFDAIDGPKVIQESLDTFGDEGWELATMITVAGEKIVAFLKRRHCIVEEKVDDKAEKLAKLWGNDGK